MDKIDNEESVKKSNVLRYAIILGGVAVTLVLFNYLVNRKK